MLALRIWFALTYLETLPSRYPQVMLAFLEYFKESIFSKYPKHSRAAVLFI